MGAMRSDVTDEATDPEPPAVSRVAHASEGRDHETIELLIEAEIVRWLLVTAVGQATLSEAIDAINYPLQAFGQMRIAQLIVADSNAACALDATMPGVDDEALIREWQRRLRNERERPRPRTRARDVVVPAYQNRTILGVVYVTSARQIPDPELLEAIRRGIGKALHQAALIEQTFR